MILPRYKGFSNLGKSLSSSPLPHNPLPNANIIAPVLIVGQNDAKNSSLGTKLSLPGGGYVAVQKASPSSAKIVSA